ncbi:MAG: alpha/beta hydrolase [Kiritimatiellaceae bacterium]|nr:alpha/beta hydrolase [Kiritimatiellaceae bacterium]
MKTACIFSLLLFFITGSSNAQEMTNTTGKYAKTEQDVLVDKLVAATEKWPSYVGFPATLESKDVIYSSPGGHDLPLTYFTQKETQSLRPAILFIHGGGWRSGDRKQFFRQSIYLAQRYNLFAVNIEYRFSQEAKYPAALIDCKAAVRWIKSVAEENHIDPNRIIVVGGSAGAHLASMTALTQGLDEFEQGPHLNYNSDVQLAVLFNGHFDMNDQLKDHAQDNNMAQFFGGQPWDIPEVYGSASPFLRVSKKSPPMLFLHGDQDPFPCRQSIAMKERLTYYGVHSEVEIYKGKGHAWFNEKEDCIITTARMEKFIAEQFKLSAPPQSVLDESLRVFDQTENVTMGTAK